MALFKFIKGALSSDSPESSKRLLGFIGYISAIIMIAIWRHDLILELLITSGTLLGLGIVEKRLKK